MQEKLLAKMLQKAYDDKTKPKQFAEIFNDNDQIGNYSGKQIRELLLTEAVESTTLIQEQVYRTIIEGTEYTQIFRGLIPTWKINSNSLRVTFGEDAATAPTVAEGAKIPMDTEDYTSRTFEVVKYGLRPAITEELIEDGLFDVISRQIQMAGERIENSLNALVIQVLLDNAGNEHDTAGSNQDAAAVRSALSLIRADYFQPTTIVIHPEFESLLLADTDISYFMNYGTNQAITTGIVPKLYGQNVVIYNGPNDSSTYTWGFGTGGEIGGLMMDPSRAGVIVMRRDITVKKYDDIIRDLRGMTVTSRFGANYLKENAICRIEY